MVPVFFRGGKPYSSSLLIPTTVWHENLTVIKFYGSSKFLR